jgi:N-acetylglucosaminyl-diphospho-decaprenol L-rhamnosyltransferase
MISVVIVTYNSEACVGACIDALAASLPDAEILVIDNASTDGSRAVAARPGTTVVELPENVGFGRACNVGASRATREHILFLNPDVTIRAVDAGDLVKLLGAVSFGLVVPASTGRFIFAERPWVREAFSQTWGALWPRELPRRLPARGTGELVWASGAALLVRASEFLGMGGFDPRYFMYFEDRDLSWRYRGAGLAVRTSPSFVAEHSPGGSSEMGERRPELLAYSLMGWLQYTYTVRGPKAAERAWTLARSIHRASAFSVEMAARIIPSARLRRKRLQLAEVTRELSRISVSSGVLQQSDACAYWPDAVALLSRAP